MEGLGHMADLTELMRVEKIRIIIGLTLSSRQSPCIIKFLYYKIFCMI